MEHEQGHVHMNTGIDSSADAEQVYDQFLILLLGLIFNILNSGHILFR